jgi:hypothetical protein
MILLRLAIIESNQDIRKMPALRTLTIAIHPATHRLPGHLHRLALVAGRFPDGVGNRIRTQVTLHALAEQLDDRPWAREQADAFHLFGTILRYEDRDFGSGCPQCSRRK